MAKVVFRGTRGGASVRILSKQDIVGKLEGDTDFTKTTFQQGVETEVPDEVAAALIDSKTNTLFGRFELVSTDTPLELPADSKTTRSSK